MIYSDLAKLYCVKTARLNDRVRRNNRRFPEDFMFVINHEELRSLRSHIAISDLDGIVCKPFFDTYGRHSVYLDVTLNYLHQGSVP